MVMPLASRCIVALFLLLPACARPPAPPAHPPVDTSRSAPAPDSIISARFRCADSSEVSAEFHLGPPPSVVLTVVDLRFLLPQVRSADGARYADSTAEFWNKGRAATFTRGDHRTTCQQLP
jgi:membrane-bound inhibitor of C-type lysozyme